MSPSETKFLDAAGVGSRRGRVASSTRVAIARTAWSLRTPVVATCVSQWWVFPPVIVPVTRTASVAWSAASFVVGSQTAAWSAAAWVTADKAVAWNALSDTSVAASRSTAWTVRAQVASTVRSTAWSVSAPVAATSAAAWSVRVVVTATRGAAWNIGANVGTGSVYGAGPYGAGPYGTVPTGVVGSGVAAWNARAGVTVTHSVAWNVQADTSVAASVSAAWVVRASDVVAATQVSAWSVVGVVTVVKASSWTVRRVVTATRPAAWHIRKGVASSGGGASWAVRQRVTSTRGAAWNVADPAAPPTDPPGTASDSFNRANSASLGSSWTQVTGGAGISGNQWAPVGAGNPVSRHVLAPTLSTLFSQVTFAATAAGVSLISGPAVHMPPLGATLGATGSFYVFSAANAALTTVSIRRKNAALTSFTTLGGTVAWDLAPGDVMRLESQGTDLVGFVNGGEVMRRAKSLAPLSETDERGVGVYSSVNIAIRLDNWSGGDLDMGGGPTITEPFTGSLGLSWANLAGVISVAPGGTQGTTTLFFDSAWHRAEHDVGSSNMYSEVRWSAGAVDADRSLGVMTRYSASTNTGYYFEVNDLNDRFVFQKVVAGVTENLSGGFVSIPGGVSPPGMIRLESEGATHRCYWAGTLVGTYTDSSITTGQRGGIGAYNSDGVVRFDDFATGAL